MNAYELAEFIDAGGENIDRKELANMLRQQADRIAELENKSKPLSDEEIAKEWSKFYPDVFHTHLIDFVRAIEERHGIK